MNRRTPPGDFSGTMRPIPRLTLRADEAAIALGISESMWHALVAEKLLPKAFNPPGHPGVALYDVDDIRSAVRAWKDGPERVNMLDKLE